MTGVGDGGGPGDDAGPEAHVPAGVRTMSVVRWLLVVVMGAVAALSIAYATGALGKISSAGKSAEHRQLYTCPMHPSIVQDHPGECPICGMTLVPRPEGPAPNAARPSGETKAMPGLSDVDLPPERVQLIGMRTAKVERAALGDSLRAVGVIAANERGLAEISVRFSGWIQQLAVSETGQRVKRGEILATVYSPEVLRAEQEYITARGWESKAGGAGGAALDHHAAAEPGGGPGSLAADARRRLELLGIAAPEIDAMASRGRAADSVPIRSPVEGTVTARNVVPGAAIQPGAPLFEVADLSKVWLLADVLEQDASRLHVGQKATLDLTAYPGETFAGRVQFIYPTLNTSTRTLRVRLEFANRAGPGGVKLRPGMFGNVALDVPAASGLVIPSEALVDTGEHQYAFVAKGGGHFEPRLVRVGGRSGDKVRVADGLTEGETVVTTGNFLLDSESRLRAAVEGQR
jgi:Cu(I)/Ag(I) efflux system membrane fusion protein